MDNMYNCRVYMEKNGDEILNLSFISIAKDEYELAEAIKEEILNKTILDDYNIDIDSIIESYEGFYTSNELYVNIEATRLVGNVDLKQLKDSFNDIVESSYKGIDILDKIKQLKIGNEYIIKYVKKGTVVHKVDILYYGDNDVYYSYREDSDYEKDGVNKFDLGDKVRIKYLADSPIFKIIDYPDPICQCIDWCNMYEIQPIEDDSITINVHESELEKVEE